VPTRSYRALAFGRDDDQEVSLLANTIPVEYLTDTQLLLGGNESGKAEKWNKSVTVERRPPDIAPDPRL
jgi:hypothetical protein